MPSESAFNALLVGFVLVLTRIGALFAFIPLPGARTYLDAPKAMLAIAVSLMLFRYWPIPTAVATSFSSILVAIAAEAALGLAIGTGVAILFEATQLWAQFIALQAGFSYATTIDPNSEADSGILLIFTQLLTSLIVFASGLDGRMLQALAQSFDRIPPGSFQLTTPGALRIVELGSQMFQIGFRLSLPVIAILLIADVALALLGKIEQHMQLSNLMFPLKTLAAALILATGMISSAGLIEQWLDSGWQTVRSAVGI
jgi:flagellar biosynthetic protein FliR